MNVNSNSMSGKNCDDMMPGMCYVPWQSFDKTYDPMQGLSAGTIFPELDKPFTGKCSKSMIQGGFRR